MTLPLSQKTHDWLNAPYRMDEIYAHIANGGSFIDLCKVWEIRYSDGVAWVHATGERRRLYNEALEAQSQFMIQRVLKEVNALSFVDVRQIFNDDHSLKPPHEWPEDVARAIVGIDVLEEFDNTGERGAKELIGYVKKVKLADKIAALNFLGKHLKMLTEQVNHTGKVTLEQLVAGSKNGTTENSTTKT